ncbi:hypothetical protein [Thiomicrorhabdus sp.]|uniref:hypothetical protein n=1 Tax=Thiomicrorhabdus sp. TaxID=2039724 RepID=UPI0029C9447E|nr:hypothetical protein [Thiomicrorhabdus sp.]
MAKKLESYQIHAYVDGQLSREECLEVEMAMQHDPELEQHICQLRGLKSKLKEVYNDIPLPKNAPLKTEKSKFSAFSGSMAASIILGMFLGAGALQLYLHGWQGSANVLQEQQQVASSKYIIHLDSDDPKKELLALSEAQKLLSGGGPEVQVDMISNYRGVNLFEVNNPNRSELEALLNQYPNLTLYACHRAIQRALDRGEKIKMLPQVVQDKPGIDTLAERLIEGWRYIKI